MKTRKRLRAIIGRNGVYRDRRRSEHIGRGGRAFLPQSRMRRIRREEDVLHSQAKREGRENVTIHHWNCPCGSIDCLGTAALRECAPKPPEPVKEPQLSMAEYLVLRYGSAS